MRVDIEPSLGMEQGPRHLDSIKGRVQRAFETAAETIGITGLHLGQRGLQRGRIAAQQASQGSLIGCGLQRPGLFGIGEIGKAAHHLQQRRIEDVPGHAARLREHVHRRLGVALGLGMETDAGGIDLHAALHHHRPAHQRALRYGPGAVSLVAAEVGRACAQLLAPGQRTAVIAGVPGEDGPSHGRQQQLHHGRVAAVSVAGQDQRLAAEVLQAAIGAFVAHANHAVGHIGPQLTYQRLGQDVGARAGGRTLELGDQRRASAFGYGMHTPHAVAGVEKAVEHLELQTVVRLQVVDRLGDGLGIGLHQVRRRVAVGLGLHVFGEQCGRILNPLRPLQPGTRCRDETGRQRRRSAGHAVALQQHTVDACVA